MKVVNKPMQCTKVQEHYKKKHDAQQCDTCIVDSNRFWHCSAKVKLNAADIQQGQEWHFTCIVLTGT